MLRDGKQITVRSEELVPGDVVILEAGDAVPADGRILESASLKIEEAALTGESVPANKISGALELGDRKDVPLGDRKNMCYMGSTVVYGRGRAVITGTGMNTEMGKIADALQNAKDEATPLQRKLNQLSKILSGAGAGHLRGDFRGGPDPFLSRYYRERACWTPLWWRFLWQWLPFRRGLAAVVTIVLSIGVTNMSRRNAVIRKLTAVETLGCTQVICSDKTGTLTQNKMTVVEHSSEDVNQLALAMALCSDAEMGDGEEAVGEPTECALVNDAFRLGMDKRKLKEEYPQSGGGPL